MIRFSYRFTSPLGAVAEISDGSAVVKLFPSLVFSDPLADLADKVIVLLRMADADYVIKVGCHWEDEPGEWRWVLEKYGADLKILILEFAENYSPLDDERGTVVFSTECSLLKFAIQIKTQLRELLEEVGTDGYKTMARRDFPHAQYGQLKELIRLEQVKAKRRPTS